MTERKISRRKALATLGSTAAVASTAGCVGQVKDAVGLGKSKLQKQLEQVRKATKKYDKAPKKAIEDGYKPMGPYVPGMGWHFINGKYIGQALKNGFDLDKPQILTYDAQYNLGSVEYGAPAQKAPKSPDLFADEAAQDTDNEQWQVHKRATHVYANGDGKQNNIKDIPLDEFLKPSDWMEFRNPDKNYKPGDTANLDYGHTGTKEERVVDFITTHPDLVSLHVWVHEKNPKGVFSPINPEFAQK